MCNILINPPIINSSGSTINSIEISGSVTSTSQSICDCREVVVTLSCPGGTPQEIILPIVTGAGVTTSTFSAVFSGSDISECDCGEEVSITVKCKAHSESNSFIINCPDATCKDIQLSSLPTEICVGDPLNFQVAFDGGGTSDLIINYGDGSPSVSLTGVSSSLVSVPTHTYTNPGNYTISIQFNDIKCTYNIIVKKCDCCPPAKVKLKSKVAENCNSDEKTRFVTIEAIIIPENKPNCPDTIKAELYIDGNLVDSDSGSSPFTLTHSGDYDCLKHKIKIEFPDLDCDPIIDEFCVPVCETKKCRKKRVKVERAFIILWVSLFLFAFNTIHLFWLGVILAATILVIILNIRWGSCKNKCEKCPKFLCAWRVALGSFFVFLLLSKSSFIFLYGLFLSIFSFAGPLAPILAVLVILLILFLIYLLIKSLYDKWVNKCCPTDCHKSIHILTALTSSFLVFGFLAGSLAVLGFLGLYLIPYPYVLAGLVIAWAVEKWIDKCDPL